ncbi:Zinc finger protein azf1 [Thalictrum thalictroides]|uniref:Zinc finger protein azf1 n=1 Tax=Thalictrum thalictroides TaxID=46969 RepID=A0A7J6WXZ1_THATH|nr:Zinc finger protein azf1 [Thalictrum thalictroides]
MRCHPEREWRGINPPPNAAKSNGGSSSSSCKELKLMGGSPSSGYFHVPKWTVKDKRGRKGRTRASPASDSASDQLDEEIPEVVYDLMLLASGRERDSLDSSLTIKQRSSEESKMKKRRWSEESESSTPLKKQPKMEEFDQESGLNGNDFSLAKKKKTKLWKDLDNSPRVGEVMEVEYKCSDCNKSFPTHQALGGHRSSHNKFNAPPQVPPPHSEEEVPVNNNDLLESMSEDHIIMDNTSGSKQQQQTHKCQICNKTFSTGQALGGHKRCHWNGHLPLPIEAQASIAIPPPPPPPPATTTTSSVASQDDEEAAASRNVLGFDLNELPAMEEGELEEEEATDLDYAQVQAEAHASFFYNSAT